MTPSVLEVIDCAGSGLERGLAHGEQLRHRVRTAITSWSEDTLARQPAGTSIEAYAARFLNRTSMVDTLASHTPDLLEEVRGIALGSGVPFELLAAYNLMDEQWWYDLPHPPEGEPGLSLIHISEPTRPY